MQMRKWRKEGDIREANGKRGILISEGVNSYGDGPERYVARVMDATPDDLALILDAPRLKAKLAALKAVPEDGKRAELVKQLREQKQDGVFAVGLRAADMLEADGRSQTARMASAIGEIQALKRNLPFLSGATYNWNSAIDAVLAILAKHGTPAPEREVDDA